MPTELPVSTQIEIAREQLKLLGRIADALEEANDLEKNRQYHDDIRDPE